MKLQCNIIFILLLETVVGPLTSHKYSLCRVTTQYQSFPRRWWRSGRSTGTQEVWVRSPLRDKCLHDLKMLFLICYNF